jgi:hypothetical protein
LKCLPKILSFILLYEAGLITHFPGTFFCKFLSSFKIIKKAEIVYILTVFSINFLKLLIMRKVIKRVLIALNLHVMDTPGLVSLLRAIIKGFTSNPNFTTADLAKMPMVVADMVNQANNLESTHTSRKTNKSPSLTSLELDQATTVMNTLTDTAHFVQDFANRKAAGDLAIAVQIITSVGFQVKKEFVKHQRTFKVVSTEKGQVHLRTKAEGARVAYLFQVSDDGGKTWSFPIVTLEAEVIITNLKSLAEYSFRYGYVKPARKPTVAAGSEQPVWSDLIHAVVP